MKVSKAQAAQNRQDILEAAARLYREHGLAGVGVAEVTRGAGLTHGGLYRHFESKDALVREACARAFELPKAVLQDSAPMRWPRWPRWWGRWCWRGQPHRRTLRCRTRYWRRCARTSRRRGLSVLGVPLSNKELLALAISGFQRIFMRKPRRRLRDQLTFSYHRP